MSEDDNTDYIQTILIILFIIIIIFDIIGKIVFIIIAIKRLIKIHIDMKVNDKYLSRSTIDNSILIKVYKTKWTCCSMLKFIFSKIIALIYLSLILIKTLKKNGGNKIVIDDLMFYNKFIIIFYIYCSINFIAWIISIRLYYKEYRIYKDQTRNVLRIFWILNFVFYIFEVLTKFFLIKEKKELFSKDISTLLKFPNFGFIILFAVISFIYFNLFLLAIFHPYDISIEIKNIKYNSNDIQNPKDDDLLSESLLDEDFDSNEYQNNNSIKIQIPNTGLLNKKRYNIELKIKTTDFTKLDFKIKIQNELYTKAVKTCYVCNFNEIALKHYNNKKSSSEILNCIKQAYNISLTLNPKRNSYKGNKKDTNVLAFLYLELIKLDVGFLLDLIIFLDIKNDELINDLKKKYSSIYKENPNLNREIERMDSSKSVIQEDSSFIDSSSSSQKKSVDNNIVLSENKDNDNIINNKDLPSAKTN